MKKLLLLLMLMTVSHWGCAFLGGAALGEQRKKQIEAGSIIY